MITFRPLLPNVPASGVWNAAGLKKRNGVGFEIFGFPTRSGRFTIGLPVPEISALTMAESGVPDCTVPVTCNCHPLIKAKPRPGRLYVLEKTKRCFMWKSESPRSALRLCESCGKMLINVASSIDLENRYVAVKPSPERNRRSARTSAAWEIDEALVSNWKMFSKQEKGRRKSSVPSSPALG